MHPAKKGLHPRDNGLKLHQSVNNGSALAMSAETKNESNGDVPKSESEKMLLEVTLPDRQIIKTVVDSSMVMMDLLVQLAAAHHLNPSAHTLVAISEKTSGSQDYKPNQCVSSVGARRVHLVVRKQQQDSSRAAAGLAKKPALPFEGKQFVEGESVNCNPQSPVTGLSASFQLAQLYTFHLLVVEASQMTFDWLSSFQPYPESWIFLFTMVDKYLHPNFKRETFLTTLVLNLPNINYPEVTYRMTVNLPRNQKSVHRVSPNMLLMDLHALVCKEKNLDPALYCFQHPADPKASVDLDSKISNLQLKSNEINFVHKVAVEHAASVPNLVSSEPSKVDVLSNHTMLAVPDKKKKGFLSFLKKEKKNKSESASNSEVKTFTSPCGKESKAEIRESHSDSMSDVQSPSSSDNTNSGQSKNVKSTKKRPAPPPPPTKFQQQTVVPPLIEMTRSDSEVADSVNTSKGTVERSSQEFHSRTSSDSSGCHEPTTDRTRPSEAGRGNVSSKISTDSLSTESNSSVRDSFEVSAHGKTSHTMNAVDSNVMSSELKGKTKKDGIKSSEPVSNPEGTKLGLQVKKKKNAAPRPPSGGPWVQPLPPATPEMIVTGVASTPNLLPPTNLSQTAGTETPHIRTETALTGEVEDELPTNKEPVAGNSYRPCSFVAPPPPLTPPPPESTGVSLVPTRADKSVGVAEDSVSLGGSGPRKFSESAHSRTSSKLSVASVNTIEDLNMEFEQTIAMAEEALKDKSDKEGYKSEMAMFVEQMSRLGNNLNVEPLKQLDSSSPAGSESDTGTVIRHGDSDVSETNSIVRLDSESDTGSIVRYDVDEGHKMHVKSSISEVILEDNKSDDERALNTLENDPFDTSNEVSEITLDSRVNVVPPGFGSDADVNRGSDISIMPIISQSQVAKSDASKEKRTSEVPVSRKKTKDLLYPNRLVRGTNKWSEEIQMTVERTPSVTKTYMGAITVIRPKLEEKGVGYSWKSNERNKGSLKPVSEDEIPVTYRTHQPMPGSKSRPQSEIIERSRGDAIRNQCSRISFTPCAEGEIENVLEEKSVSMIALPVVKETVKKFSKDGNRAGPPNDAFRSSASLSAKRANSAVSVGTNPCTEKPNRWSLNMENMDIPKDPEKLRDKLEMWKGQLREHDHFLSAQCPASKEKASQIMKMKSQLKSQQKLIQNFHQSLKKSETQKPVVPPPLPPPPPPPIGSGVVRAVPIRISQKLPVVAPKPKVKLFEPQLDPREELMIAIKNFGGREKLTSVPLKNTNWKCYNFNS